MERNLQYFLIFVTGGATLALQLISSRIMTPFFGVSLYIWSSILSITLFFLALGYFLGGRLSNRLRPAQCNYLFYLVPPISGAVIIGSAVVYPLVFRTLAQWDLLWGSFVACFLLLGGPLLFLSAMNPILISIQREARKISPNTRKGSSAAVGDGGSGTVFCVSTIGSVLGVMAAAFIIIPNMSNSQGLLVLAAMLSIVTAITVAPTTRIDRRQKTIAGLISGLVLAVAGVLSFVSHPGDAGRRAEYAGITWRVVANQPSTFGAFKVVEIDEKEFPREKVLRVLFQNGLTHGGVWGNGEPFQLFTRAMEVLGFSTVPNAKSALVLGVAAGHLPTNLAKRNVNIDLVEIEPKVVGIAENYFGFSTESSNIYIGDARTFVSRCPRQYDLIFVDLFQGDGVPEHLVTKEFFADVRACLTIHGALVMNSFLDTAHLLPYRSLMATIASVFGHVALYQEEPWKGTTMSNGILVAKRSGKIGKTIYNRLEIPSRLREKFENMVKTARLYDKTSTLFTGARVISDERNSWATMNIAVEKSIRSRLVNVFPTEFLVN